MTYKGAIDEVISLANNSLMPVIFKPSLKKIAETLEMERPKEFTLSEVETYANEHNYVLWTDEMSEKALALIKADRERNAIPSADILEHARAIKEYCNQFSKCEDCGCLNKNYCAFYTCPDEWNLPEGEKE